MSTPEFNEYDFPEIELNEDVLPRVPLEDVLALQSLAMGKVRTMARTRVHKPSPRTAGFVLGHISELDGPMPEADAYGEYDKPVGVDTYLGVIIRKPTLRQWRLTISFLQHEVSKEAYGQSVRDISMFEWRQGDHEALGSRRIIRNQHLYIGEVAGTVNDTDVLQLGSSFIPNRKIEYTTVDREDCEMLRGKIEEHVEHCVLANAA